MKQYTLETDQDFFPAGGMTCQVFDTHASSSHNDFSIFSEVQIYAPLSSCSDQIDSTKCSLWASGTIPEVNVKLLSNSA